MHRRPGRLTMRHMIAAVALVLVVNAQLTWWIVFVLGQNRARLQLERGRLVAASDRVVVEVEARDAEARAALDRALAVGMVPGADPAPPPWRVWTWRTTGDCIGGWRAVEGFHQLALPVGADRCLIAEPSDVWMQALQATPDEVELVPYELVQATPTGPPGQRLAPPLDGLAVQPTHAAWEAALEDYRRRIVMMVSEGTVFALLLLVIVALMWRTLRREVELERQHRNFLSAITHELKSPLAAIRLSLETVLQGRAQGPAGSHFLTNALGDAERLQGLVQKVLEVTRYGRSGGSIEPHLGCLSDVVTDVVEAFRGRVMAAGGTLEADVEPELWVELDAEALSIALSNLVENAIKYGGDAPQIAVQLAAHGGEAVIDVSDSGPGVPEEEVPFIFNRFYRGGDELTRTAHGTGLGLYLVRRIVMAHAGRVAVHRTGPGGTTFRVVLPGARAWEESA